MFTERTMSMTHELNEVLKIFFFNIRACQSDNLKHEQNRRVALEYSLRMQTIQESRIVTRILLIIIFLAFNPRPLALESLTLPLDQQSSQPRIHTTATTYILQVQLRPKKPYRLTKR